jgi:hypothetical protein
MKIIALLFLSLFMGKGCSKEDQKDLTNTNIVYTANTRGFYQKITIQNHNISISNNRNEEGSGKTTEISDENWKELVMLFNKIDLEKLSTYEGPTQKRFYDGAPNANMIITHKEKEYNSTTFDHGNPPIQIEDLVKKIILLAIQE